MGQGAIDLEMRFMAHGDDGCGSKAGLTIQGSDEWHAARLGRVTASRIADVTAKTKTGEAAARKNYRAELVAERLTGVPAQGFTNAAMQWGTDTEPQARAAYAFLHDADVEEVGFVVHPRLGWSGASPDGLVGADGLVEIKCPNTATHLETLLGASVPGKYVLQMQWQMACTERQWCDFVSFDPRLSERHQLFCQRVRRDDDKIGEIEAAVLDFLDEVEDMLTKLEARNEH